MAGAETIMTFALGFLIASLIALVFAAPLWRRAEKVTRKRLEASLPVSSEEIAAEKDKLRADFALSTRKLELSLEKLRKKAQAQMASVQQRGSQVVELESEIKSRSELEARQEAEIARLSERLAVAEAELKRRTTQHEEMKARLGELQAVLDRQSAAIKEASSLAQGHRDEIETLKGDVEEKSTEIAKQAKSIAARDAKLAECGERVAAQKLLVAEKAAELKETAALAARLKSELAGREAELKDARERAGTLAVRERELAAAKEEIATLKSRIATMGDEFRARVEADNRENALLRQRIGDLAADVQRMTDALDFDAAVGQTPTPLAPALRPDANGGAKAILSRSVPVDAIGGGPAGDEPAALQDRSESLADRIRSLQRGILG